MQNQYGLTCRFTDSAVVNAQLRHHLASMEAELARYPCAFGTG
jgi:hypothetical protein